MYYHQSKKKLTPPPLSHINGIIWWTYFNCKKQKYSGPLCEKKHHAQELDCDWCLITVLQAEKKHKSFQELDRFMHYYTRFKNHEHSYQVNRPDFVLQWCCLCSRYAMNAARKNLFKTSALTLK